MSRTAEKLSVVLCIGLAAATGCSLQETQTVDASPSQPQTAGWIEKARIPDVEAAVNVKLDTGAETSSMNAEILEQPDEESEAGGMIKFRFEDGEGNQTVFERPIVRWVRIKSRDGGFLRRPVVQMKFCVAGRWIEEEVNLADRDEFNYPILIGRNMLKHGHLVVDSSQTFIAELPCPIEEAQQ